MAQPFFRGNYGSALARVDTRPIMEAGRAQGQMFAQAGAQIGNMIKEYGLNKQKREEMTNEIESSIKMNPGIVERLTGTGDETFDKKQQTDKESLVLLADFQAKANIMTDLKQITELMEGRKQ